jgi:hypothetical protein
METEDATQNSFIKNSKFGIEKNARNDNEHEKELCC